MRLPQSYHASHSKKNFLLVGLHFGVPTSFLQDRVMGKINADTAKSGPAPLVSLEEEDHG